MNTKELKNVLADHLKWLQGEGGSRANLSEANLFGANLIGADLSGANLSRADLSGADLFGAGLSGANLFGANLSKADLIRAGLSGANLSEANLFGADLFKADLIRADLSGADLSEANLFGANLIGADLSGADLSGADLSEADLIRADLSGAKNIDKTKNFPYPQLDILKAVKGKIRAYKLINENNKGIYYGKLVYKIGKTVEEKDFETDERILCAKGINVATLNWCEKQKEVDTQKILEVEFTAKDIVAIPYATDGKFRIKKCKIIKEVVRDESTRH